MRHDLRYAGWTVRAGCSHQTTWSPHDGPDQASNILCLCPNDHVRLDYGAITITNTLEVLDRRTKKVLGPLIQAAGHLLDLSCIQYHREHHG